MYNLILVHLVALCGEATQPQDNAICFPELQAGTHRRRQPHNVFLPDAWPPNNGCSASRVRWILKLIH